MREDLYFLPIIARALRETDPQAALRKAFELIEAMGRQPQHRRGYRQFLQLMDTVDHWRRQQGPDPTPAESFSWEAMDRPPSIELFIEKEGQIVAQCTFAKPSGKQTVDGIVPGQFAIKTDTGRVLWQGTLAEEDLLWSRAFPGQPLSVAADTGSPGQPPTRTIRLLDETLTVRVFAGIESGSLTIELTPPKEQP